MKDGSARGRDDAKVSFRNNQSESPAKQNKDLVEEATANQVQQESAAAGIRGKGSQAAADKQLNVKI